MAVERKTHSKTGKTFQITTYRISNSHGFTVSVMDFGAILASVAAPDGRGNFGEVTLGFRDPFRYTEEHPYFGATVGRFANRIAAGRFRLDGREHRLACNQGKHHLHGGRRGFDKVMWAAEAQENAVVFRYTSPDGEEGYPGTLEATATYTVTDNNQLIVDYTAETDSPTPVNLTNHAYWNQAGDGEGDILGHRLQMHCRSYLPVDRDLMPTGEILDVSGTPMDFTEETAIGARIDQVPGGYDHCYVVDEASEDLAPVLTATDPAARRCMEVRSTQPGVQLYTGNFLDGIPGRGGRYGRHAAFCTETQAFPDAVNQPAFPSAILRPGESYSHRTVFRFFVR
jgi:aldose 1-epimerase